MARHGETSAPAPLSGWQLAIVAAMSHAPLIVAWVAIPGAFQFGHVVAMPLVYGLGGATLLCAALAFVAMARRVRHPGGLYALVSRGLGRPVGLGTAAVVLVSYLGSMISLHAVFGLIASGLLDDMWGVNLPARYAALLGVVLVTSVGALPMRRVVWALGGLLLIQLAWMVWFDVHALRLPTTHSDLVAPLDPGWLFSGSFGIALCFAVTAFIGLDTSLNFVGDVQNPRRSVSLAAYLAGGIMTAASAFSAWAIGSATGGQARVAVTPDLARTAAGTGQTLFELLARIVGVDSVVAASRLVMLVLLAATVGTGIVLHKAVARQLSGLAGDGVLPASFRIERRSRWGALVPVLAAAGTWAVVSTGDRIYPLWLGLAGGLGITGALALTSVAAVSWFLTSDDDSSLVGGESRLVAGAVAAVVTSVVFVFGMTRLTSVFPQAAGRPWWLLPLGISVAFGGGLLWTLVLRVARPAVYASIGRSTPAPEPARPAVRPLPVG